MAQRNQFDPQNQIFLKIWQKPYSSAAMKTGMKLSISSGEKESGSGAPGSQLSAGAQPHVCADSVWPRTPGTGLPGLGAGTQWRSECTDYCLMDNRELCFLLQKKHSQ